MQAMTVGRITVWAMPVLSCLVAIPLVLGRVSRNTVYGIRTARSLSSDAAWATINRRGGWAMILASVVGGALILLVQQRLGDTSTSLLVQVGVLTFCMTIVVISSVAF